METIIHSCKEFHQINSMFSPVKNIKLDLSFLTESENDFFSNALNKELNSCGCKIGKYFVVCTFIVCISCLLLKFPNFNISFWFLFLILFFSAIAGKLLGLSIARLKVFYITKQIKRLTKSV